METRHSLSVMCINASLYTQLLPAFSVFQQFNDVLLPNFTQLVRLCLQTTFQFSLAFVHLFIFICLPTPTPLSQAIDLYEFLVQTFTKLCGLVCQIVRVKWHFTFYFFCFHIWHTLKAYIFCIYSLFCTFLWASFLFYILISAYFIKEHYYVQCPCNAVFVYSVFSIFLNQSVGIFTFHFATTTKSIILFCLSVKLFASVLNSVCKSK